MVSKRERWSKENTHGSNKEKKKHGSKRRSKQVRENWKTHVIYIVVCMCYKREKGTLVYIGFLQNREKKEK